MPGEGVIIDNAFRVIEYLKQLAQIRKAIVREVNSYEKVFWLSEIPLDDKHCFTQAWQKETDIKEDLSYFG